MVVSHSESYIVDAPISYLVSAPLKASKEEDQAADAQQTANIVDFPKHLTSRLA